MTDRELEDWAKRTGIGTVGNAVLRLLARLDDQRDTIITLRKQIKGHVERMAAQIELLSQQAEGRP